MAVGWLVFVPLIGCFEQDVFGNPCEARLQLRRGDNALRPEDAHMHNQE